MKRTHYINFLRNDLFNTPLFKWRKYPKKKNTNIVWARKKNCFYSTKKLREVVPHSKARMLTYVCRFCRFGPIPNWSRRKIGNRIKSEQVLFIFSTTIARSRFQMQKDKKNYLSCCLCNRQAKKKVFFWGFFRCCWWWYSKKNIV